MALREASGVQLERRVENALAHLVKVLCLSGVHGRRRHISDAGMAMLIVVPQKEVLTERSRVFDGIETRRKPGLVFQRLELRF